MEKGAPIRSISRCMAVLQAVSRHGPLTMSEAATAAELPYPTASRVMQTLIHEGMIEQEPVRKRYRVTAEVQSLSNGFQPRSLLLETSRPLIVNLTQHLNWPISVTTRVGLSMVVRDCTHALSPLTFVNYYPGYTLPVTDSASGTAYFTHSSAEVQDEIVALSKDRFGAKTSSRLKLLQNPDYIASIRDAGFAAVDRGGRTPTPGLTSVIAVPLFEDKAAVGAIALSFFASKMTVADAVDSYLGQLQDAAGEISAALGGAGQAPDDPPA